MKIFSIIKKFFFFELILKKIEWEKSIALSLKSIKNLKSLKYHIFVIKNYFFLVFVTRVEMKVKKYLRKKNKLKC